MTEILFYAALAYGYGTMDAKIQGEYTHSHGMSYCAVASCNHCVKARNTSILNRPTGYGYSSAYNFGLEPTRAPYSY